MKTSGINSNVSQNSKIISESFKNKSEERAFNTGGFAESRIDHKENTESNIITTHKNNDDYQVFQDNVQEKSQNNTEMVEQERNINYSKNEVKEKISSIFLNFAKYYKEEKYFLLSQQALIKIVKKLNIIDEEFCKLSDIDIIFRKVNPHSNKINEKQFLDFIVKLVNRLYPQEFSQNAKKCVDYFIATTFEPYSKFIQESHQAMDETSQANSGFQQKSMELLINRVFDSRVSGLLNSIYFAIKEIYTNYFHYEINQYKNSKQIIDGSLSNLEDFCKDFEVLPYVLNIHQLVNYYNIIIKVDLQRRDHMFVLDEKRELGKVFTLSKFCLLFIHFSLLSYSRNNQMAINKNVSDVDKLILFLEKLENSNGLNNLERRTNKPHTSKLTLIPAKNILQMVDSQILKTFNLQEEKETYSAYSDDEKGRFESKKDYTIDTKIIKEFNEKNKTNEDIDLRKLLSVNNEVLGLINSKLDSIRELYLHYSKMGDKLHFNRMSMSSFLRFLKDCDVIAEIPKDMKKSFYNRPQTKIHPFKFNLSTKSPMKTSVTVQKTISQKTPLMTTASENQLLQTNANYHKTITQLVNVNQNNGRLTESDANIIFFSLTGPKNFDNSSKIKHYFDRNSGYNGTFDENLSNSGKGIIIGKSENLKNNKMTIPLRMDFFLFVKSFELLAVRLYPNLGLNKAVVEFIENKLDILLSRRQPESQGNKMMERIQRVNRPEIINFLKDLGDIMLFFYSNYCSTDYLMYFDQFFEFYKDFSLFPDIVNLIQLKGIFSTLAEIFANEMAKQANLIQDVEVSQERSMYSNDMEQKRITGKNEKINYNLFMNSLAMTAMFFKFNNQIKDMEKLVYLIERMNQSKGMHKIQKKTGKTFSSSKDLVSFLLLIKEKHPEYYHSKLKKKDLNQIPSGFDDIYGTDM